ncbi:hypothetical protein KC330_g8083 [Hortaea werneckii]|nr:hypothetical protein KC330_g8083 [Hortaea werneckii]
MTRSVHVVPGSGKQGRAVAEEFIKQGISVHSLVRDASSASARALSDLGATIHTGDLGDMSSITKALQNADAVFLSLPAHPKNEVTFASNVISAAKATGVKHFIYTSVARTGEHENFPFWKDDYPSAWYWKTKKAIEDLVRSAGFEKLTIFRPAFFMQNFCRPEVEYLFPGLADSHTLSVPFDANSRFDLVDTKDIAKFAVAAAKDPYTFAGKEIGIAGESLTAHEIGDVLSKICGSQVSVNLISRKESDERVRNGDQIMCALELQRDVGYGVSLEEVKSYGIALTPLSRAITKQSLRW